MAMNSNFAWLVLHRAKILKATISWAPNFISSDWMEKFKGHVNALQYVVGEILMQIKENGHEEIMLYFSGEHCTTNTADNQEFLACSLIEKIFRLVEISSFKILSDRWVQNVSCCVCSAQKSREHSRRLKYLDYLLLLWRLARLKYLEIHHLVLQKMCESLLLKHCRSMFSQIRNSHEQS